MPHLAWQGCLSSLAGRLCELSVGAEVGNYKMWAVYWWKELGGPPGSSLKENCTVNPELVHPELLISDLSFFHRFTILVLPFATKQ